MPSGSVGWGRQSLGLNATDQFGTTAILITARDDDRWVFLRSLGASRDEQISHRVHPLLFSGRGLPGDAVHKAIQLGALVIKSAEIHPLGEIRAYAIDRSLIYERRNEITTSISVHLVTELLAGTGSKRHPRK